MSFENKKLVLEAAVTSVTAGLRFKSKKPDISKSSLDSQVSAPTKSDNDSPDKAMLSRSKSIAKSTKVRI